MFWIFFSERWQSTLFQVCFCFFYKLKHSNGVKTGWSRAKLVVMAHVHWWRDRSVANQRKQNNYIFLNAGIETRIIVHATSQHSTTWWSDGKLLKKKTRLWAQLGTRYELRAHADSSLDSSFQIIELWPRLNAADTSHDYWTYTFTHSEGFGICHSFGLLLCFNLSAHSFGFLNYFL